MRQSRDEKDFYVNQRESVEPVLARDSSSSHTAEKWDPIKGLRSPQACSGVTNGKLLTAASQMRTQDHQSLSRRIFGYDGSFIGSRHDIERVSVGWS